MSSTRDIQRRLAALRRRLRWIRRGVLWPSVMTAGLLALGLLFLCDVWLRCSVSQRLMLFALAAASVGWVYLRASRPFRGIGDSDVDLALRVEREHHLNNDLVAALQFAAAKNVPGESMALKQAVMDHAHELAPRLDFQRGVDWRPARRRAGQLALVSAGLLCVALGFPRHVRVFGERLLLSNRSYPTATTIDEVVVNGVTVFRDAQADLRPRASRCGRNQQVRFLVRATGQPFTGGHVECQTLETGRGQTLALQPVLDQPGWFSAELPRLLEPFDYRLVCGDARTEPARVQLAELPVVKVSITVTPPHYTGAGPSEPSVSHQTAALPGSRVDLQVDCLNDKALQMVAVRCNAEDLSAVFALAPVDATRHTWKLPAGTRPWSAVESPWQYELHIVDVDGLQPEAAPTGEVRLRSDQPPAAIVQTLHQVVLPNAAPVVDYRLFDDYGIGEASLVVQVERRAAPSESATTSSSEEAGPVRWDISLPTRPLQPDTWPFRGEQAIDLAPLGLQPGDRVRIIAEVVDHRGDRPGQRAPSEPVWLQVADEAGVLAAIRAIDERADGLLGEAIQQQLEVGELP